MPQGKHVKIIIAADGSRSVDAINFTGSPCRTVTGKITAALGGRIGDQHDKPDVNVRERRG